MRRDPSIAAAPGSARIARRGAPLTWLPETAAGADSFGRVFALRPNLFEAWREFEGLLWRDDRVNPELLVLCRLRLAHQNGARWIPGTPAPAVDAGKVAELDSWWTSERFTPLEKACLRFAEQFALDPSGIGDEEAKAVTEGLGDAGTVAFVEALAIFDGFTRFCAMLDVAPEGDAP